MERQYIVNEEGEIIRALEQGDRILTNKSVSYLSETTLIKNRFVKVNDIALEKLSPYMTFISLLFRYISYTDGALRFGNGKYVKPSNLKIDMSTRTVQRKFRELIDLDVIHKCKNYSGSFFYAFNPYICMRGKRITKELAEEFKNSKWRFVDDNIERLHNYNLKKEELD